MMSRRVAPSVPESIEFHMMKSNFFRVVHCDGMWGGATPLGYMTMSVFSERSPIPVKVTHAVGSDGKIGGETKREVKHGIVREVEVELIFDLDTAKSMVGWLNEHISTLEKTVKKLREAREP